ncbi:hypothetical protein [Nocardia jejuensis]|uniref:hypothetical protein n=1 Tax=Nocardia jejuensis TaxID=328049 RepID=UPI000ABB1D01|nr:hypothetical protein [Nocardia jejuensis]
MVSAVLLLLSVVQLGCVVLLHPRIAAGWNIWLLRVVGVGLAYDAAVFGLGAMLGTGPLLHGLSIGRFVGHAVLTPLLVLWAAPLLANRRSIPWWGWVLFVGSMLWGVAELSGLVLEPRRFADTLRYVPETVSGPPFATLLVVVVLLVTAIVLWRRGSGPWLTAGVIAMIVTSAAAVSVPALGNVGEAVLMVTIVVFERRDRHATTERT